MSPRERSRVPSLVGASLVSLLALVVAAKAGAGILHLTKGRAAKQRQNG